MPPAAKNEVESVSVSLLALQAQLRLVWAALLKEYTEWWPLREGLLNFLDELRHSLAQVAAQARRLVVTGCAPPGAFILQQVDGDVAYLASVLVMKQTEAATRLKGSNNWIEAMELTRFIGRCSHWVHEAHTLKLLT